MNISTISGNVVAKPEMRTTQNGTKVAVYSIASSTPNPKAKGEFLTDYYNIVAWGDLAETCCKVLDKGTKALVVGRFKTRNYEDKDGKKVYVTELNQNELWLAPPKKEDTGSTRNEDEMPW